MRDLLAKSNELTTAGKNDWRVRSYRTAKLLVADALLSLENDHMPVVVTKGPNDHWVIIKRAHVDAAKGLLIELLDPDDTQIPNDTQLPGHPHNYADVCSDLENGTTLHLFEVTKSELIGLDLRVDLRPNPVVNGTPLTDYTDQFIGVFYSKPTAGADLIKAADALPEPPKRLVHGTPGANDLLAEIADAARAWKLPSLQRLMDSQPEVVAHRTVRGIEAPHAEYMLMSLLPGHGAAPAPGRGPGLLAAFAPDGRLVQMRFTTDQDTVRSLARYAGQDLWWTGRWLPTLASPFYPFVRSSGAGSPYLRLADERSFDLS
jgi:hypothetical protein